MPKKISRRQFLRDGARFAGGLAAVTALPGTIPLPLSRGFPHLRRSSVADKVIILGMDGMDPNLVRQFVAEGSMPNFRKLMGSGKFGELQTTNPPHSPVAWSSFMSGCNPGGHGIFDFVHRDPASFTPYMSTSRSFDSQSTIALGPWSIPLRPGRVELMWKGPVLWNILEQHGVPVTVVQIPANFPVTTDTVRALSGMGTPDLLGSYGTCTYITDAQVPNADALTGTRVLQVVARNHTFRSSLEGPKNSLRSDGSPTQIPVEIHRDPFEPVVRIELDGNTIILQQGEWTGWIPLSFELVPLFAAVSGMVRIYVKEVHPHLRIYVSPINIDPLEPSLPICSPPSYSRELAEGVGRFHTQGFPADTKALSEGVLSDDEFVTQAHLVLDESMKLFEYELERFNDGVFFFYFSSIDQTSHMLLRSMNPTHPLFRADASERVKQAIRGFYQRMDLALGRALEKVDSRTVLFALSDHGFAPFTREFNLNTWLHREGYLRLTDDSKLGSGEFFQYVDWENTQAYGIGINGLYINVAGRDRYGRVRPEDARGLKGELSTKLAQVVDPQGGQGVIRAAYDSQQIYSGPFVDQAPDLIVGYRKGYRSSDETVLGKLPKHIIGDRTNLWSSDHCMDPGAVPGMLLSTREWKSPEPGLWDMAPSILRWFGIAAPREMDGRDIFL